MVRQRLVVFSGAGVSAESGLRTFRDSGGLWEEFPLEEVATPEAWARDPKRVLHFYDLRRAQVLAAQPNAAHEAIARLEQHFDLHIITQNIDDLHERAGSTRVLHLHGEVRKARSTADPTLVVPVNGPSLPWGASCPLGSQLRPHIVWFGEEVPLMAEAIRIVQRADILLVVGTSLQVYPAAGLVHATAPGCVTYVVDPGSVRVEGRAVTHVKRTASEGVPWLADRLVPGGISG